MRPEIRCSHTSNSKKAALEQKQSALRVHSCIDLLSFHQFVSFFCSIARAFSQLIFSLSQTCTGESTELDLWNNGFSVLWSVFVYFCAYPGWFFSVFWFKIKAATINCRILESDLTKWKGDIYYFCTSHDLGHHDGVSTAAVLSMQQLLPSGHSYCAYYVYLQDSVYICWLKSPLFWLTSPMRRFWYSIGYEWRVLASLVSSSWEIAFFVFLLL